ncbi:MAG: hypothetical protein AAF687_13615 [Pseudomonadota bacterium]
MTKLPDQFVEDRALRDAARSVFMADIKHARTTLSGTGIAKRVASRVGDGAKDVFEVAKVNADDNRGAIAAFIGALILFFAREPILEILGLAPETGDEAGDETDADKDPETELTETSELTPEQDPSGDNNE